MVYVWVDLRTCEMRFFTGQGRALLFPPLCVNYSIRKDMEAKGRSRKKQESLSLVFHRKYVSVVQISS